jgi:hypothetical protein
LYARPSDYSFNRAFHGFGVVALVMLNAQRRRREPAAERTRAGPEPRAEGVTTREDHGASGSCNLKPPIPQK